MIIYCIFDRKSHTYGTLFTNDNDTTAQRYFQYICSLPGNEMIREDVELYSLGSWDTSQGILEAHSPYYICSYVETKGFKDQVRAEVIKELMQKGKEINEYDEE